jgi:hypothetical protein
VVTRDSDRANANQTSAGARPGEQTKGDVQLLTRGCVLSGAEIGRVQLTLNDGSQLEDDGVGDVSLLIGRHGDPAGYVEIFAPDGALLSKRNAS